MKLEKEQSIDIDDIAEIIYINEERCYECLPCDHPVTFRDKDGNIRKSDYFTGPEILFLMERCKIPISQHFEVYRNHNNYKKLKKNVFCLNCK